MRQRAARTSRVRRGVIGFSLACALLLALVGAVIPLQRLGRMSVIDALAGR